MASLTLVVEDREVRTFALGAAVTTIGRAQDNDIVINNLALSRRHAEVHRRGVAFELLDRGSQNGVYVNEQRIEGPRRLEDRDVIKLGSYTFIFAGDPLPKKGEAPEVRTGRRRRRADREPSPVEQPTPPPAQIEAPTPPPSLEPSAVPMVVLTYNELELQRFALDEEECLIGRAKECDVQIAERRLSRRHCLLFHDDDGRWLVKDLGSQNGTYVNRRRVREPQLLQHGDVLNFAEYTVLFLSDAASYDGPDAAAPGAPPAPRPSSGIEREQTELPEAYLEGEIGLGAAPEPVVSEPPRARRARAPRASPDREPQTPPPRASPRAPDRASPRAPDRGPEGPRTSSPPTHRRPALTPSGGPSGRRPPPPDPQRRPEPKRRPNDDIEVRGVGPPAPGFEEADIPDHVGDAPRPDPSLDDWYASRDGDEFEDEPSVLLERSKSSMSQLLSTMMVDKKELDRNLEVARRKRRFAVEVRWGEELLFEGPLDREVTVLGTDAESDLPLRGRYVAGRHSLLVRVRDSLLLVRLGSSSAARVNGLPRLQAFLKSGDVIQIDETTVTIAEA